MHAFYQRREAVRQILIVSLARSDGIGLPNPVHDRRYGLRAQAYMDDPFDLDEIEEARRLMGLS
jgi:hypothetical protein